MSLYLRPLLVNPLCRVEFCAALVDGGVFYLSSVVSVMALSMR